MISVRFRFASVLLAMVLCVGSSMAEQGAPLTRIQAMTGCDRLAADPDDRARPEGLPGVATGLMDAIKALEVCKAAIGFAPDEPRFAHQAGRAAMLIDRPERWTEARGLFETAAQKGYGASHRMLAELLGNPLARVAAGSSDQPVDIGSLSPGPYSDIMRHLRLAAEAGDALALVLKGDWLLSGALIYRDALLAESLFRQAAEMGSARGDLAIGQHFAHGPSARRDYGQARASYERATDKEEPDAFVAVGEMAELGLGEIRDFDKARRLYRKAVELGSIKGLVALGRLGDGGPAGKRKLDEEALKKAAALGDPEAVILLARQAVEVAGTVEDRERLGAPLRQLARARSASAVQVLGVLAERAGNEDAARNLYKLAAGLGNTDAAVADADFLIRGGLDAQAEPILKQAAVRGNDRAALRYAEVLIRLFRQQEAEGWFQLAAYANVDTARRALGTHYREGTIGRRSLDAARTWYKRAIEGGDEGAKLGLGMLLLESAGQDGAYDEARRIFQSIRSGPDFADAQWQLGMMALNGLGQEVNPKEAVERFDASAKAGNLQALGMVAALYEGDQLGEPDPAKAREWYLKAAEKNDTGAMFRLASLAAQNVPDPAAEAEALRWLQAASQLGMVEAKLALAAAYHHGIGGPKEPQKAFGLLQELDNIGDFSGRLNLARAYEIGIGTPNDLVEAQKRYQALFDEASTPLAQLGLARIAEAGTASQPADLSFALYLYSAVADTVNDAASVAVIRLKSQPGSPLNDEAGARIEMQRGLANSLPMTLAAFARYACPKPEFKQDCEAAVSRLEELATDSFEGASGALAGLLKDGVGMAKDETRSTTLQQAETNLQRQLALTGQFVMID